jgi:transposase
MGKKSVSMETKWQAIGMHKSNLSNREIARRLDISENCVRSTLKKFRDSGSVADKPRSGAPKKLTKRRVPNQQTKSRQVHQHNHRRIERNFIRRKFSAKHHQRRIAEERPQFVSLR